MSGLQRNGMVAIPALTALAIPTYNSSDLARQNRPAGRRDRLSGERQGGSETGLCHPQGRLLAFVGTAGGRPYGLRRRGAGKGAG